MLAHRRVTPSIKFAGTHLNTWVEKGTVRVKCLAQEHNTMSPARSGTRTARSGVELTNHKATAPPRSEIGLRVLASGPQTPTQSFWEYPPPDGGAWEGNKRKMEKVSRK